MVHSLTHSAATCQYSTIKAFPQSEKLRLHTKHIISLQGLSFRTLVTEVKLLSPMDKKVARPTEMQLKNRTRGAHCTQRQTSDYL